MTQRRAERPSERLLTLHGLRVLGYAEAAAVAGLYGLAPDDVAEQLADAAADGFASRTSFAGTGGWSLTESGRAAASVLVAEQLDADGVRPAVAAAHRAFLPLNGRLGQIMTRWQVRDLPGGASAANDHRDPRYDDRVLADLARLLHDLRPVSDALAAAQSRLGVHQGRLEHAMARVWDGEDAWIDSPAVASINLAWMHLHEDLLATLELRRGQESPEWSGVGAQRGPSPASLEVLGGVSRSPRRRNAKSSAA